jgi:hypothetical protein
MAKALSILVCLISLSSFAQKPSPKKFAASHLAALWENENSTGSFSYISKSDSVLLIDLVNETTWKASFFGKTGYIKETYFDKNEGYGEFKSWFLNDLLAAQAVREKAIKDAERIAKSKLAAKRRSTIINKYGATLGKIILEGKVRIGMTKEMAIDAWGKPNDINKTITRYAVSEQWVYDGGYLYFENGKLTTIQN